MRGHQQIIEYQAASSRFPNAVFVIEGKSSCDSFGSLITSNQWFPEITVSKSEPVADMDFSFLDGQMVHAVLGENYRRSFRICEAIAKANPLRLFANIAGVHPILEWNQAQGFFENE